MADPDQSHVDPHEAQEQFDLGLDCLHMPFCQRLWHTKSLYCELKFCGLS